MLNDDEFDPLLPLLELFYMELCVEIEWAYTFNIQRTDPISQYQRFSGYLT